MKTRLYQKLTYTIHITREPEETWPPLKAGKVIYDVAEAEVEVAVYLPDSPQAAAVFDVRPVYATQGRILVDGKPGGTMIGRHVYHGTGHGPAARHARTFEHRALTEAKHAYTRFIAAETERAQHQPS